LHVLIVIDVNYESNLFANLFFPKVFFFSHVFCYFKKTFATTPVKSG